jgi:hypothetical protein
VAGDPPTPNPAPGGAATPPRRSPRPLRLFYNWWSIAGTVLAVGGATSVLFFAFVGSLSDQKPTYPGLVLLPFFLLVLLGLALVLFGILRESRRRRGGRPPSINATLSIDLVKLTRRQPLFFTIASTAAVTGVILAVGSGLFQMTELTESNEFCGETCHSVMHPEWIRYAESAHARVNCVQCHVGRDAGGYIRSKVSGIERVVAMVTGDITRPIPTPIHDLRPARELCGECHTPGRFVDSRQIERSYFLADEENTRVNLRMLINVGGRDHGHREGSGIHYHMFVAQKVEYIARDPKRQEIAWVKVTRADGSTVEYGDPENPIEESERAGLEVRTMDCLDCHNRPAHRFIAPIASVNDALAGGVIPPEIPFIKLEAVKALDQDYATREAAMAGIAEALTTAYREEHPEFVDEGSKQLPKAIDAVQAIYRDTIFPEMKARWSAHPDNIGHLDWPGCFRCHNDALESADGDTIFTTCDRCHKILSQGADGEKLSVDLKKGKAFVHPEDGEEIDEYSACSDCHTGGAEVYE